MRPIELRLKQVRGRVPVKVWLWCVRSWLRVIPALVVRAALMRCSWAVILWSLDTRLHRWMVSELLFNANDCMIYYWGPFTLHDGLPASAAGKQLVMARHRVNGRRYFVFRSVTPSASGARKKVLIGFTVTPADGVRPGHWCGFSVRYR